MRVESPNTEIAKCGASDGTTGENLKVACESDQPNHRTKSDSVKEEDMDQAGQQLENRYTRHPYQEDRQPPAPPENQPNNRNSESVSQNKWSVYRTRFLVHARQLTEPMLFIDALGREQSGRPGDYLVESSEGVRRITTKALFEDIYVALEQVPLDQANNRNRHNGAPGVPARPTASAALLRRNQATA